MHSLHRGKRDDGDMDARKKIMITLHVGEEKQKQREKLFCTR